MRTANVYHGIIVFRYILFLKYNFLWIQHNAENVRQCFKNSLSSVIVRLSVVLKRTVGDSD